MECGLSLAGFSEIMAGDVIEATMGEDSQEVINIKGFQLSAVSLQLKLTAKKPKAESR